MLNENSYEEIIDELRKIVKQKGLKYTEQSVKYIIAC